MFCPQCRTEYREGFSECADCRVALVAVLPPLAAKAAPPQFVNVFETTDTFALGLATASLDEAEIGYKVDALRTRRAYCIQVAPEDEADARDLVEPLLTADLSLEEDEDPPA